MTDFSIRANIVDITNRRVFEGFLHIKEGRIASREWLSDRPDPGLPYLLPGFIDSHVHIESSMLVPSEFARLAVVHGTVSTVSDPHEIANVCGIEGVRYMIENGNTVNFKFYFGAPSCVPATVFETAGDTIDVSGVRELLSDPRILYLSEMMNFPGVIFNDGEVMQKIKAAYEARKPVDGHAPGLRGIPLKKYVAAGISTDHECFTKEEALEKLSLGMKILIREGSAAKNFDALADLLHDYPEQIMFCSDDKHPDSLVAGHINDLCRRAVDKGINLFHILQAACINPVKHYSLPTGILNDGDDADFILVEDLRHFNVLRTFINGICVAENGASLIQTTTASLVNRFMRSRPVAPADLVCPASRYLVQDKLPVIEALDGQLITRKRMIAPQIVGNLIVSDPDNDVLKIAVINRYGEAPPAMSFVKNFGLKNGAIASSVAHDSHNIIAVGADDDSLVAAVNEVIRNKGGICCALGSSVRVLPLPVAGLMSNLDGYAVAADYTELDKMAKSLGSKLSAPFMTLSFMALLVIPSLKLSDKGLFDGDRFQFVYDF